MHIFLMAYPEGYLWEFPGFYSISVPYGMQNNFFFCSQVGLCMICFCEFKATGHYKLAYYSLLTMICQIAILNVLRGHYFIDVISSVVFGHYFWIIAERLSLLIDVKIFKAPFHKRFPNFISNCASCKYPINEWAKIDVEYTKS